MTLLSADILSLSAARATVAFQVDACPSADVEHQITAETFVRFLAYAGQPATIHARIVEIWS
jgi:hypothetical protein